MELPNHYEILQISRNAEPDTIHSVYQLLAARFAADSQETSDPDKFARLQEAFEVLSDPERRAEYDAVLGNASSHQEAISPTFNFIDGFGSELNRRLALLAMLYKRRSTNPDIPEVSLFEVEEHMGIPRERLEFTIWYLHKKGLISRSDGSELTLAVDGADYLESRSITAPVLQKLLTGSTEPSQADTRYGERRQSTGPTPISVAFERRVQGDRRKRA